MKNQAPKIAVVGIGNTIGSDDGIGAYICTSIDKRNIKGVKTIIIQQLHTELISEFFQYDFIIFADAAITCEPVEFYRLKMNEASSLLSSH